MAHAAAMDFARSAAPLPVVERAIEEVLTRRQAEVARMMACSIIPAPGGGDVLRLVRFYRWVQSSWEREDGPLPADLARMATTMHLPLGCEGEDWHTGPGIGFCVGMKALGFGKHCSRRSFGYAGALGGGNLVVGMVEPELGITIAAAIGPLGRAASALKAVLTALYEDVLPP